MLADRTPNGFPGSVFDLAELGALFETHWPRLTAIVHRRLDNALAVRLDPDEVVNAAYLDAQRKWMAYKANRTPPEFVWLYQIVIDRLIEEWRTATRGIRDIRRQVPWPEYPSIDLGLRLATEQTGPATAAIRAEEATLVRQALDRLKEPDRDVILLRGYDDLSFREIGDLLGVGENTATVRYVRALKKLKAEWQNLTGESRP